MTHMPVGGYRFGTGPLHRMRAGAKLALFLLLLLAICSAHALCAYGLLFLICGLLIVLSGIGFRAVLVPVGHLWVFFLVILLMNTLLFDSRDALCSWWIFSVSQAGIRQGVNVVLRVILLMILSNLLTATTPPMALTAALARCLTPLKFLGVPTEDVAMILGVAIQFIPTLLTESDMIRKAQTARGAEFESVRLRDRLCCATQLVVPIFLAAFRRADELAMAMEARGYHCQSIGKKVAEKAK